MSFDTIRKLFKHIHKLSFRDLYLAQIVKSNLRTHFDIYKKTKKQMKIKKYKQNDGELLEAFEKFMEQTTIQNSQLSQKAKMKLIELCYGLNKFVDENFQLRKDFKSAQINYLTSYQQYVSLQSDQQKEFVKKLIRKVLSGNETYPYTNLTDFFKDFRSQTSISQRKDIINHLDQSARSHISSIIQDKISISPDYRTIYNIYFSIEDPFSKGFSAYIDSRYIMIDFDNFQYASQRDQAQLLKQHQLIRQRKQKRLLGIKKALQDNEKLKKNGEVDDSIQVQVQKKTKEIKKYILQNKSKMQQSKKYEGQQRKLQDKQSNQKKTVATKKSIFISKKQNPSDTKKQINRGNPQNTQSLIRQKQQISKIYKQSNQKIKIIQADEKQLFFLRKKLQNNKKQTKGFLKKK